MFLYADETLSKVANMQITNESNEAAVLQSPLRKALSPININGNQKHHEASPLTQTPFSATYSTKKGLQKNSTPLEKFSAQSSTLKVHVVVLIPLTKCTL
jgi:kinesin family protein 22